MSAFLVGYNYVYADGTYNILGTGDASNGSNDALNFSQGKVWTVDEYGNYIWLTQVRTGPTTHWTWSNDEGATWEQGSENYSFLTRGAIAYDSNNDKLHVIWAATDNNDGIIYRRYGITRNGSNEITDIVREDSGNINLQLDTSASRTLGQPVALWVDDGSANGILVAVWIKNGGGLFEVRASMRKLSLSAADGVAGNWVALDGSADTFATDGPLVDADKIYTTGAGAVGVSAGVRGGSSAKSDDIYVFVATSGDEQIRSYRAAWDSVDTDWSGGWQTAIVVGNMEHSSGYNLKYELITKPVLDTVNDRLYVGWARWKDGGDGDTVSIAYLDDDDVPSATVDAYASLGTHAYAPTIDIAYDVDQDFVYVAYVESTTNGTNGSISYKTYDGTTLSSATKFYTNNTGAGGEDGGADIPIIYENRSSNDRLLFAFRVNGSLPPTDPDPHEIFWGYLGLPTQPTVQFTTATGSGLESVTVVNAALELSTTFTRDVEVNYAVTGGSATGSGTDYTLASGTATIPAGDNSVNIAITITSDSLDESDETLIVTISSPVFATLGSNTTFTYTITDDDTTPEPEPEPEPEAETTSGPPARRGLEKCLEDSPEFQPEIYEGTSTSNTVNLLISDESENVNRYKLEYGISPIKLSSKIGYIGTKGLDKYTVAELAPNTVYHFRLRADNTCQAGEWSEVFTIKTQHDVRAVLGMATNKQEVLPTLDLLELNNMPKELPVSELKEIENIETVTEVKESKSVSDYLYDLFKSIFQ